MAKKLILLLLIIPIVVMILLFAASQTVANLVDVRVEGIEITGDKIIYLYMDKGETSYTLEYTVYPTGAKNKGVYVGVEAYGDAPVAEFDFNMEEEGKVVITPLSAGSAKLTLTTIERGFPASVVIHVISTKLQSIDATIDKNELVVGEKAQVSTTFSPENASNKVLYYTSSNPSVATVSDTGEVRALRKGLATITVVSDDDPTITDSIDIVVKNTDTMDLGLSQITTFQDGGSIPISIESVEAFTAANLSYRIFDAKSGNPIPASVITAEFNIDGEDVVLNYRFINKAYVGKVRIEITFQSGSDEFTKSCEVSKVDKIEAAFNNEIFAINVGQKVQLPYTLIPEDAKIICKEVTASGDYVSVRTVGKNVLVEASKAGYATVTLTIQSEQDSSQVITISTTVVVKPTTIDIVEASETYGLEDLLTVGGYKFEYAIDETTGQLKRDANGDLVRTLVGAASGNNNVFALNFQIPAAEISAECAANLKWKSSMPDKVMIDEKTGVISFADDGENFLGEVEFYVSFSYAGVEMESNRFTVRCVENGINVYSYADLYYATKATEHPIVLQTNVTDDFGYIGGEYVEKYATIHTTYDDTYYKNAYPNQEEFNKATEIKILLEFRNDLYGNNKKISADNITYKLGEDKNGDGAKDQDPNALFQGPLDFVRLVMDNNATISVKAQDNICFALYEGVTVTNVELRGCDLGDDGSGSLNLVELNYIGTTVEVFGDNVTIAYSRLTNGRTVLRAFGDINDAAKDIHVTVTNSILAQAREFIMRLGSNQFINAEDPAEGQIFSPKNIPFPGDYQHDTTKLPFKVSNAYNAKKNYYNFTDEQKQAYDEAFINTFVTVRNSVFQDSGIFAIGMDSHFAGGMLHNGAGALPTFSTILGTWHDLAKTSYGAKIRFEGEVGLYNWKAIDDVDSSTLIEVKGVVANSGGTTIQMELNVKEMIAKAQTAEGYDYKDIVTKHNGDKDYVHAGIAFFGGGKNYCVFDSDSDIVNQLAQYSVSLGVVGRSELQIAAGDENFHFFIFNNKSAFNPAAQESILTSEKAYDFVARKK